MTALLWILGVLAALIVLLCLTRVGIRIVLSNGSAVVEAAVGLLRIRIYPRRRRTAAKKPPSTAPNDTKTEKNTKKALPRPDWTDLKDAARTLWPPLKRALDRTRRGLRVDPLRLSLTLGGQADPADAAQLCGWLHTGMWAVMPQLERLVDIPDPRLHIDVDFNAETAVLEGELGVAARFGTLFRVGLGVGLPALRWFLRYQKKRKTVKETTAAPAA